MPSLFVKTYGVGKFSHLQFIDRLLGSYQGVLSFVEYGKSSSLHNLFRFILVTHERFLEKVADQMIVKEPAV